MAVTSTRATEISFSGDLNAVPKVYTATNTTSPVQEGDVALTTGANTITPPAGATGLTIVPATSNTILITLKGVTGDTGVKLHKTQQSSFGLDSTQATICLTAASGVTVTLIWT